MVTRRGSLKGQVRLTGSINPNELASEVLDAKETRSVLREFRDLELVYFRSNTPVGGTGDLVVGWDALPVRKSIVGLSLGWGWVNTAPNATFRIAGRGSGKAPSIEPLKVWAVAIGAPIGFAWAAQKKIAREGTDRWQEGTNWVGIRNDGSVIPGGRVDTMGGRLAALIQRRLN